MEVIAIKDFYEALDDNGKKLFNNDFRYCYRKITGYTLQGILKTGSDPLCIPKIYVAFFNGKSRFDAWFYLELSQFNKDNGL